MPVYCVEVSLRGPDGPPSEPELVAALREAGLPAPTHAHTVRLFLLEGPLTHADAQHAAVELLSDAVTDSFYVRQVGDEYAPPTGTVAIEVHPRPGVMDPVAESTLAELTAEGMRVAGVRTGRRYVLSGRIEPAEALAVARRVLANDCIEQVVLGSAGVRPAPQPPVFRFELRHVPLRELGGPELEQLSRRAHLFLNLEEMRAIQAHYRALGREPTDLELETLAQTWSEHCIHKTLKAEFEYRGAPMPLAGQGGAGVSLRYENLLKDTIARATRELMADGRGPQCLSVFQDNAGIIALDAQFGLAFKVETHNHPSAIEPYGGAATGIGGVIRDVIGCGLGAKPIANTDVFCVAPQDWPAARLPKGVLHPRRVLRGIVRGVADYGNRMGIPTVNGAVLFDVRYLGNPLVYCGCLGLIPRDRIEKAARAGDRIVLIGGRTGRDGIHGATFSSAELTDTHADEFSHAVQIGNAITEKRFLDAVLQARDAAGGCLYSAITDCGAGGLSSAVGEMGQQVGAVVDLEHVPLKYVGLRYDEIWISEAQERMVLAVPPANLDAVLDIMRAEEVEATVIGTFGAGAPGAPQLVVRYQGHVVGELAMGFLHDGVPKRRHVVQWQPGPAPRREPAAAPPPTRAALLAQLKRPNIAAKEWIIRQYDHEVQGGTTVKPLTGPRQGPADAAVIRPRGEQHHGAAIGCGVAPHLADVDPYWMAVAGIDEAVRNVVCVGGDPARTALLDNFCWGRTDDPRELGGLVRACQACYDVARAFGTPFISGKDSLNNEFALDERDVEPLLEVLHEYAGRAGPDAAALAAAWPALAARVRETRRLAIPGTLLISALSLVEDVRQCVTPDLKQPGAALVRIGAMRVGDYRLAEAARTHEAVARAIRSGLVAACHDASDGGWLTALAEMALAGGFGAELHSAQPDALADDLLATYVVETTDLVGLQRELERQGIGAAMLGSVRPDDRFVLSAEAIRVSELRQAWAG